MSIMHDWVVDWALMGSFAVAIVWLVVQSPIAIIVAYYLRDRSHDDD